MRNRDIDRFFRESGLEADVERREMAPTAMWMMQAAGFPVLIQTQESANRMRIVVFIAEASDFDGDELWRLLEANYHSALDARYALADDKLVAVFLHPFAELSYEQFVLGFSQALSCAETWGSSYTGGTFVFGPVSGDGDVEPAEGGIDDLRGALVEKIRDGDDVFPPPAVN